MEDSPESHMSTAFHFLLTKFHCYKKQIYRLKKFREEAHNGGVPVLYLNAGDTYTGTPWFSLYKDKIVTAFLNLLKPDAIVIKKSMSLSGKRNCFTFFTVPWES